MEFVEKVKTKYPYLSENHALELVDRAKMFYYSLKFPFVHDIDENSHPIVAFKEKNWIMSACEELIERQGFNSAVAYRENGVSWSLDGAQISQRLCELIIPEAMVITRG